MQSSDGCSSSIIYYYMHAGQQKLNSYEKENTDNLKI